MFNLSQQFVSVMAVLMIFVVSGCGTSTSSSTDDSTTAQTNTANETSLGECPAGTDSVGDLCAISGTVLEDIVFTAGRDYLLQGPVFIGDGETEVTLTIDPGVTIYGEKNNTSPGALIIMQNAKINAEGTKDQVIVFTSDQLDGQKARGDWGGIIINGKAPINCPDKKGKDFCEAQGEGDTGIYGGDEPEDSSGILKYVRVEFGGIQFSEDNELNGIAFQGVGSGTVVDYVQVHMNRDDGIEFFGGTVNAKHIVLTGTGDDSLDWTYGWTGKAQFIMAKLAPDAGDQGIEADNHGDANDAEPRSNPTLANLTFIGHADADIGLLLREGSSASIANSVFVGFGDACFAVDQEETYKNGCGMDMSSIQLTNVIFDCETPFEALDPMADYTPDCSAEDLFTRDGSNQTAETKLENYTPGTNSPLVGASAAFENDDFFETVDFIGAVSADDDWTAGWTVGLD
ncbi:MAG: hypothetical protein VX589_14490 [Myxococcota bacterium]|nr:hypothetical protein [Myxococcota bacterium]